jgi:ribonuclease HII
MKYIIGIDEAGRGPLIGSMVICLYAIPEHLYSILENNPLVQDSKKLSSKKRKQAYHDLNSINGAHIIKQVVSPLEIDGAVLSNTFSLNDLTIFSIKKMIYQFLNYIDGFDECDIFLDTLTSDAEKYSQNYREISELRGGKQIRIKAEIKADENIPIVSAASIIAKETRELEIEILKKKYGDFGSGYPADKKTISFLEEHLEEMSSICRKSWSTWTSLLERVKKGK